MSLITSVQSITTHSGGLTPTQTRLQNFNHHIKTALEKFNSQKTTEVAPPTQILQAVTAISSSNSVSSSLPATTTSANRLLLIERAYRDPIATRIKKAQGNYSQLSAIEKNALGFLKHLDLSDRNNINIDELLHTLDKMTSVISIRLSGADISDDMLIKIIKKKPLLQYLYIAECEELSDEGFNAITSLTELIYLDVKDTDISAKTEAAIRKSCTKLTTVRTHRN